jgi:hypothetical protein
VTASEREGWYEDPAGHHQFRWFSAGKPTELIKDGQTTGHDAISMSDPTLFEGMHLAEPPDTAPLLHQPSDKPPHFELLNFGAGPVAVVNTNAERSYDPRVWTRPAGLIEKLLVLLPLPAGFLICAEVDAPLVAYLAIAAFSMSVAVIGRSRRRRPTRRLRQQPARTASHS